MKLDFFQILIVIEEKALTFYGEISIVLLNFLDMFLPTCDFNRIHEEATQWVLQIQMLDAVQNLLNNRMAGIATCR